MCDWLQMRVEALACGLTPEEFWRCTPAEIYVMLRSRGRALETVQQITAWHAAIMVNMWSNERVTPDQLLGKSTRVDLLELADSPEELRRVLHRGDQIDG